MVVAEKMADSPNDSEIKRFFKGKSIFVTGGTGFLGKVLLEKLLHSCPGIQTIYVLLRGKRGKTAHERMKELMNGDIFEAMPGQNWKSKLIEVEGELSEPGFGLSSEDKNLLVQNVNIVFHCAATVKFDERLKDAININVRGTSDVISLCREMHHLESLVYVSTAFSHCERKSLEIDEEFYPPGVLPKEALKMAAVENIDALDKLTPTLLKGWPNTYTFTKALAEDLIRTETEGIPSAIFRPGMVVGCSSRSSVPGFVDNLYGPTGFVVGIGYGIIKVVRTINDMEAAVVPADMCINGIIAAAWKIGTQKFEEPPIYNFTLEPKNPITWSKMFDYGTSYGHTVPLPDTMWYNFVTITQNRLWYNILWFFLHLLPAILMDIFLLVTGDKPKMVGAHKKIDKFIEAVQYFGMNRWRFGRQNLEGLLASLTPSDREEFNFNMATLEWSSYMKNMLDGIRLYLLKQKPENIPACRKRYQKLKILHYTVKYGIIFLTIYFVYWLLNFSY